MAAGRGGPYRKGSRCGTFHRKRRFCLMPYGFTKTGAVALHRGVRTARCCHAAECTEGPGEFSYLAPERRNSPAGQSLLRQIIARQSRLYFTPHDPVLQSVVGNSAAGRENAIERTCDRRVAGVT